MSDYIPAVILGCAFGDAMGMPFEMRGRGIHPNLQTWEGTLEEGIHHKLPAGHWTDDTEMTVCLAKSLIEQGKFSGPEVAKKYVEWSEGSPTGMGGSTRNALVRLGLFDISTAWKVSGERFEHIDEVGSGTVMRVAPLGVFYSEQTDMIRKVTREDAYITHHHTEAHAASLAVASFIAGAIRNQDLSSVKHHHFKESVDFMFDQLLVVDDSITARVLKRAVKFAGSPDEVVTNLAGRFGNAWQIAVTSLCCAIYYWEDTHSAITKAVKLGGDTDTRGAVVGAIHGAIHGLDKMIKSNEEFIKKLNKYEELIELDKQLWQERPT